jgi:hypothetical protein
MKSIGLLLLVGTLLAAAVLLAVALWSRDSVDVAHLGAQGERSIGGMSAFEVRELIN